MPKLKDVSAEMMANSFVAYLMENKANAKHVRRVASWIGFVVLGIDQIHDGGWDVPRLRQLRFHVKGKAYRAAYKHGLGTRGGIEIFEAPPGKGLKRGKTILEIKNLEGAADFFRNPKKPFS